MVRHPTLAVSFTQRSSGTFAYLSIFGGICPLVLTSDHSMHTLFDDLRWMRSRRARGCPSTFACLSDVCYLWEPVASSSYSCRLPSDCEFSWSIPAIMIRKMRPAARMTGLSFGTATFSKQQMHNCIPLTDTRRKNPQVYTAELKRKKQNKHLTWKITSS